jgi:hypothetical protein
MDIIDQYNLAAEEFALGYGVTNPHIISIIASVMMTRDKRGIKGGGGFVQSIVNNDLYGAVSKADTQCYQNLKVIVAANQHSFLD